MVEVVEVGREYDLVVKSFNEFSLNELDIYLAELIMGNI